MDLSLLEKALKYKKVKSVEVIIPCYNEEETLLENIPVLCDYFQTAADYEWQLTIADNASTDKTEEVVKKLMKQFEHLRYVHFNRKGRGFALRQTFSLSQAEVVAYMDADLSTNYRYFNLLLESISCGFDIAIGSRLLHASQVKRKIKREFISRCYNLIIKAMFFNRFSDAQCGFKIMRTDVIKFLLPIIKNNNWFFDTELLLLAEHHNYQIFDVPVEWIDDLQTKVNIIPTVLEDLKGLLRVRFTLNRSKPGE